MADWHCGSTGPPPWPGEFQQGSSELCNRIVHPGPFTLETSRSLSGFRSAQHKGVVPTDPPGSGCVLPGVGTLYAPLFISMWSAKGARCPWK